MLSCLAGSKEVKESRLREKGALRRWKCRAKDVQLLGPKQKSRGRRMKADSVMRKVER